MVINRLSRDSKAPGGDGNAAMTLMMGKRVKQSSID